MTGAFLLSCVLLVQVSPRQEVVQPAPPLVAVEGRLELSLDECVRKVLERNLGLKMVEQITLQNRTTIETALGAFDPELYASATGGVAEEPPISSFQSQRTHTVNGATGIRGLYASGLKYDLGYSMAYSRLSPSNPFFGINPTISSALALNLSQPLLRGAGYTVNEAPVEQAKLLVARGDLDLYTQLQSTTFDAVSAYWNLVRARRERDTAKNAFDVAEELVRDNQKRLDAGTMTRLDVLTAAAEAARRKETLIRAENGVGRNEDALKLLLSPGSRLDYWNIAIDPSTTPELLEEHLPDEETAIAQAFDLRSDLQAIEVDLRAADLSVIVAKDAELPLLDLAGSYGYGGVAGNPSGPGSKTNVRLWGDSLQSIRDRDFPTWSVGVNASYPLGNRTASSTRHRAELEKERVHMTWMEKRMEIVQEMRGALRDLVDAKAATEAAHEALVLAREQYQAELVRLENQHSTTFQVREMQRDMFQAEDVETAAITQYEILRAGLEKARGDLAQSYGVDWKPEPRPKDAPKE